MDLGTKTPRQYSLYSINNKINQLQVVSHAPFEKHVRLCLAEKAKTKQQEKRRSLVTIRSPKCVAFPPRKTSSQTPRKRYVGQGKNGKYEELLSLLRSQLSLHFTAPRKENTGALRATLVRNRVIVPYEKYLVSKVLIRFI